MKLELNLNECLNVLDVLDLHICREQKRIREENLDEQTKNGNRANLKKLIALRWKIFDAQAAYI